MPTAPAPTSDGRPRPVRRGLARWLRLGGAVGLAGLAGWLVMISWMRWMEPLIDFGREVYLPWRILAGQHLGRDFVHPYGPLSVYGNALLFSLFGVGVRPLVVANLALLAGVLGAGFVLLRRSFGYWPATAATSLILIACGLSHLSATGNYSFAFPYAHEATHGMALLLLLLLVLARGVPGSAPAGAGAGALLGAILLTKTEYVFAGACLGLLVAARWRLEGPPRHRAGPWLAGLAGGTLGVLGLAWASLAPALGGTPALATTLNGLLAPFVLPSYSQSAHVLRYLGIDRIGANLWQIGLWSAGTIGTLGAVTLLVRGAERRLAGWQSLAGGLVLAAAGAWLITRSSILNCGSALPALLLGGVAHVAVRWRRQLREAQRISPRLWGESLLLVAGIAMLARMAFAPRIMHYGFFQAFLATAWAAGFLTSHWPEVAARTRAGRTALRLVALTLVATTAVLLLQQSLWHFRAKQTPIGTGADQIYGYDHRAYPRHALFEEARRFLTHQASGTSLLVLPEGVSLNYFTRRTHPLRILDVLPATLPLNGSDVLADLRRAPPDHVVLIARDDLADLGFAEYGATAATGRPLIEWLAANYESVVRAGEYPFGPHGRGLWVLQRK